MVAQHDRLACLRPTRGIRAQLNERSRDIFVKCREFDLADRPEPVGSRKHRA